MATTHQKAKLNHRFDRLDVDQDGYVQRSDYEKLAERLRVHAKLTADDAVAQEIDQHMISIWESLSADADTDTDGKISRKEWTGWFERSVIHGSKFDQVVKPAAVAVFKAYDTDGDGELSFDEFVAMRKAEGVESANAEATFHRLDTDRDGILSLDEMTAAIREFYTPKL